MEQFLRAFQRCLSQPQDVNRTTSINRTTSNLTVQITEPQQPSAERNPPLRTQDANQDASHTKTRSVVQVVEGPGKTHKKGGFRPWPFRKRPSKCSAAPGEPTCSAASGEPTCAICLEPLGTAGPVQALACGHAYCRPCVGQHVATRRADGLVADCPMCKAHLTDREAQACCPARRLRAVNSRAPLVSNAAPALTDVELSELGLQRCPRCRIAIEKNGGCNQMTCRCGHRFQWVTRQPPNGIFERYARESNLILYCASLVVATPIVAALTVGGAAVYVVTTLVRAAAGVGNPGVLREQRRMRAWGVIGLLSIVAGLWPAAFVSVAWCVAGLAAGSFVAWAVVIRRRR